MRPPVINLSNQGLNLLDTSYKDASSIILDDNNFRQLECLNFMTNVQQLSLAHNKIIEMYPIAKLQNITILNLACNNINLIDGLWELSRLTWVNLSGNKIKKIENLSNNVQLKHLDLSENKISNLGDLSRLDKLKTLLLHCNDITNLDMAPAYLPSKLCILSLAENKLVNITELSYLSHLKSLLQFAIQGNPCASNLFPFFYAYILSWFPGLTFIDGNKPSPENRNMGKWLWNNGITKRFGPHDGVQALNYLQTLHPGMQDTISSDSSMFSSNNSPRSQVPPKMSTENVAKYAIPSAAPFESSPSNSIEWPLISRPSSVRVWSIINHQERVHNFQPIAKSYEYLRIAECSNLEAPSRERPELAVPPVNRYTSPGCQYSANGYEFRPDQSRIPVLSTTTTLPSYFSSHTLQQSWTDSINAASGSFAHQSQTSYQSSLSQLPPSPPCPHHHLNNPLPGVKSVLNTSLLVSDSVFFPLKPTISPRRRVAPRSSRSDSLSFRQPQPPAECCVSLESHRDDLSTMTRESVERVRGGINAGITECSQVILDDSSSEKSHSPTLTCGASIDVVESVDLPTSGTLVTSLNTISQLGGSTVTLKPVPIEIRPTSRSVITERCSNKNAVQQEINGDVLQRMNSSGDQSSEKSGLTFIKEGEISKPMCGCDELKKTVILLRQQVETMREVANVDAKTRQLHVQAMQFLLREVEALKEWKLALMASGIISEPPSYRSGSTPGVEHINEALPQPPIPELPTVTTDEQPNFQGDSSFHPLSVPQMSDNSPSLSCLVSNNAHLSSSDPRKQREYSISFTSTSSSHISSTHESFQGSDSLPATLIQSQDMRDGDLRWAYDRLKPMLQKTRLSLESTNTQKETTDSLPNVSLPPPPQPPQPLAALDGANDDYLAASGVESANQSINVLGQTVCLDTRQALMEILSPTGFLKASSPKFLSRQNLLLDLREEEEEKQNDASDRYQTRKAAIEAMQMANCSLPTDQEASFEMSA